MKKISIALIAVFTIVIYSCNKTQNNDVYENEVNLSAQSALSTDYGSIHNDMLLSYLTKFEQDQNFVSTLTEVNYETEIENRINQYTTEYVTEHIQDLGFTQAQYDNIVSWINNNPFIITNESVSFQNFYDDLQDVVNNYVNTSSFESEINNLETTYLSMFTEGEYILAVEASCETAIYSNQYWSNTANTNSWLNYFNVTNSNARPSKGDIVYADAVGAIGGTVQGARAGFLLGGGGALAGGMIGFVAGAANASIGAYIGSSIQSWLGFDF